MNRKTMNPQQAADFLDAATITQTIDRSSFIVHVGRDEHGRDFVMVNDAMGYTTVTHLD